MHCQHEGCLCQTDDAGGFCSDHCREHVGQTDHGEHPCECGHAACQSLGE